MYMIMKTYQPNEIWDSVTLVSYHIYKTRYKKEAEKIESIPSVLNIISPREYNRYCICEQCSHPKQLLVQYRCYEIFLTEQQYYRFPQTSPQLQ